jgi:hypothetical protein
MIGRRLLKDESGMTLVELLVATATGVVVMAGITFAFIIVLRETNRVVNHVDANQRARLAMTDIMEQLHSSCVAYDFAPVREKSTDTTLMFQHQTGSAVQPTPLLTKLALSGTTLTQYDYVSNGGVAPEWTYPSLESPTSTQPLATNLGVISGVPLFRYYAYSGSGISATPLAVPLTKENAERVVKVSVSFVAGALKTLSKDANAATPIQDSALLRLSPASFESNSENPPCQ